MISKLALGSIFKNGFLKLAQWVVLLEIKVDFEKAKAGPLTDTKPN